MKTGGGNRKAYLAITTFALPFVTLIVGAVFAEQDRYSLKAPDGIAFTEFRGYDQWQDVAVSAIDTGIKAILANPTMIRAYKEGVPDNGKPFPDGSVIVKIECFYDYRTNVAAYPKWQAWMKKTQPKLMIIWGKHDLSFDLGEPERYQKDVPNADIHVLDAGHFALDTKADEIADLVRQFVKSSR